MTSCQTALCAEPGSTALLWRPRHRAPALTAMLASLTTTLQQQLRATTRHRIAPHAARALTASLGHLRAQFVSLERTLLQGHRCARHARRERFRKLARLLAPCVRQGLTRQSLEQDLALSAPLAGTLPMPRRALQTTTHSPIAQSARLVRIWPTMPLLRLCTIPCRTVQSVPSALI